MVPANEMSSEGILNIQAPGGWRARLSGIDTKIVLFTILFICSTAFIIYEMERGKMDDKESYKGFSEQHKTTQMLLKQVLQTQDSIIELYKVSNAERREDINEMVYILSLPQNKREELKLEMPNNLRKKLNGNGR